MSKDLKEAWDEYSNGDGLPTNDFIAGFNAAKESHKNIFNLVRWGDHRDILIYAFRYAICRTSHSKDTLQNAIKAAWPELSRNDRRHIKIEIKEHHDDMEVDSLEKRGHVQGDSSGWKALLKLED